MMALAEKVSSFLRDEEGSITVEFVIWVPWLLFYMVFVTSAYLAMDSRLEAIRASITLADVVSRFETSITPDMKTNLDVMTQQLVTTAAPGVMTRISSIRLSGGNYEVQWSMCQGGIKQLDEAELTGGTLLGVLPPMAPLSTVLLVETYVPYMPISEVFGLEPVVWSNRKAVMPRFVPSVTVEPSVDGDGCGATTVS